MRDITLGDTIYIRFTTRAFATGIPTALGGAPALSIYEENNLVPITAGVSVIVDYNSVAGLNQATIVATSGNGYESGKSYDLVITTGTVDSVSVVGEVVGSFTCEAAPVNWNKVASPATAVDLSGTDIQLVDTVTTYTGNTIQTGDNYSRLGAPAGASIAADLVAIDNFVDEIETAVIANAAGVDIAADIIAVKAETADILADTGGTLDTKINDIQGATFATGTDSLEAIRDRGDAAWVTGAGGSDRLLLVDTTIATLASQISFTLTAGSADDAAYNNCTIVIENAADVTQKAIGVVLSYTGATLTVTLKEALAFTIATTDKIYILAENSLKSTVANRQLDVTANGNAGIDWANVENPATAVDLSATDIQLVDTVTTLTDKTGFSLAATGLDAIVSTATGMVEIARAIWDRVLTGATHNISNSAGKRIRVTQEAGAYEHGAVWVDTVDGMAGTTPFDNGTITSPVLTFADAILIADNAALNIKRFEFSSDSVIVLAATLTNRAMSGHGWILQLGNQDISNTHFINAEATGVATGSNAEFHDSKLSSVTLGSGALHNCAIAGTFTCGAAGNYHLHICHAGNGGTTPIIDVGAAVGDTTLLIHGWQGGFELQNLGAAGTDIAHISGDGHITLNANCVGGTINLQGNWEVTDNSGGAVTVNYDDDTTKIARLFKFLSNKLETTATEIKVYDDAGIVVDHKASISDDLTTFTRGKFGPGP